jgi:WD40 repeat protein
MKDAYNGIDDSDRSFIESLVRLSNKEELNPSAKKKKKTEFLLDLESMSLNPENIVRVAPSRLERITQLQFLPSNDVKMVVAGCKAGDIGLWNVGQSKVFLYHPHRALISGISVHPNCLSKVHEFSNS